MFKLFPDPGNLPTAPPPVAGERISLSIPDLPPRKERHRSLRNPRHPHYDRFLRLRVAATEAMAGRQWFCGAIALDLVIFSPSILPHHLNDYLGGVMDTLDGSHGAYFTYLPIVYQDDCQVVAASSELRPAAEYRYTLGVSFVRQTICEPANA